MRERARHRMTPHVGHIRRPTDGSASFCASAEADIAETLTRGPDLKCAARRHGTDTYTGGSCEGCPRGPAATHAVSPRARASRGSSRQGRQPRYGLSAQSRAIIRHTTHTARKIRNNCYDGARRRTCELYSDQQLVRFGPMAMGGLSPEAPGRSLPCGPLTGLSLNILFSYLQRSKYSRNEMSVTNDVTFILCG